MLKDNIRFLEVLLNRHGQSNGVIALYFDGAINYFSELPKATDKEGLEKVYNYIKSIKEQPKKGVSFFINIIKKLFNNG